MLSFDDMHIDSKVFYDCGIDQIFGPHSKVQVVLLRGLTSKWKQPVYFDFNTTMNKIRLCIIIRSSQQPGLKVCGSVSDLGGCGTLWKELGVSTKKPIMSTLQKVRQECGCSQTCHTTLSF